MIELNPQNLRLRYARVSTYGQTLDAQLAQLRADGCARIYREKVSGAQPTWRELLRMLRALAPGDVVTVTRIDRLARSTFDLFAIVKQIVDARAQFRSLAEPWAATTTSTGRLMIAVLGGLADVQRDPIRTVRRKVGAVPKRGQQMGRPLKLMPQQQRQGGDEPRARRCRNCRNWLGTTTSHGRRCHGSGAEGRPGRSEMLRPQCLLFDPRQTIGLRRPLP